LDSGLRLHNLGILDTSLDAPLEYFSVRLYRNTSNPTLSCEYECRISRNRKLELNHPFLNVIAQAEEIIYSITPFARPGTPVNYFKLEADSANKVWAKLEIAILRRFKGKVKPAESVGEDFSASALAADDLSQYSDEDMKLKEDQILARVSEHNLGVKMFGLDHPIVRHLLGLDMTALVSEIELEGQEVYDASESMKTI
jgi:hypothetical protein